MPLCESCFKEIENAPRGESTVTHPRTHAEKYKPGCLCCSCRRMRKNYAEPRIEIMERAELRAVLSASKRAKPWAYIAFRMAVNGMLTASELVSLRRSDIVNATPCRIRISKSSVPIECGTIETLEDWLGDRKGRIFPYHEKAVRREFASVLKSAGIYPYGFSALRQTGIWLRGSAIRSGSDLRSLRQASRIKSFEDLAPYLPPSGFMDWMRRISWAR